VRVTQVTVVGKEVALTAVQVATAVQVERGMANWETLWKDRAVVPRVAEAVAVRLVAQLAGCAAEAMATKTVAVARAAAREMAMARSS
jgi:hypothetical protein